MDDDMSPLAAAVLTDSSCLFVATIAMLAVGALAVPLLGMALDTSESIPPKNHDFDE